MNNIVDIEINGDFINVKSLYNSEFVSKAKLMGGKWDNNCWRFNALNENLVRDLCIEIYGTDGDTVPDVVTVEVEISDSGDTGPVCFCGWPIARAYGRDSGAKVSDNVVLLDGTVKSGGSVKNWKTIVDGTFLIHRFPRKKAELLGLKVVTKKENIIEALISEKNRLLKRLSEIDAILEEGRQNDT
ncbi:MAG: hypothetical protein KBH82_10275 [Syntrophorhabdaceae bacterium]|nr:hypothetical protein [Syntrophorhabdaceae bacterium]HQP51908.1 hypothetical protein [Syntrophorhabdaceae bacterium]